MQTVLYKGGCRYNEKQFKIESDFENLLIQNSKILFGQDTIIIDSKKKLETQSLGGTIPDCFLFDLSDIDNPEFYIIEVELAKHSFFNHIFPQITKFFAFFKNQSSQSELIEKIHSIIISDSKLQTEFKNKIGNRELYLYIKDLIENSQNILLVIDNEKKELPEIIETYTDTWGKIVKVAILKEYISKDDSIITISPDFENIETFDIISPELNDKDGKEKKYTEEYHLDGIDENTKEIYVKMKSRLFEIIPAIIYNPQRYYISLRKKRNFAYFQIRKKKINIVVMMHIDHVKEKIHAHQIKPLSQGIQNFYNGDCCKIIIEKNDNLEEIITVLDEIQR